MLVFSFVEVTLSSRRAFGKMFRGGFSSVGNSWRNFRNRNDPNFVREDDGDSEFPDPAAPEDRVPTWAWVSGLAISIILTCALCATQYHMNVGEVILALILGFIFSFLAVQV